MSKLLLAIFAHPDDEAFGPSATLLAEARAGATLHLVTLTAGEDGTNPDKHDDLKAVRLAEWRRGGRLMGATGMHYFGFRDGCLCNTALIDAADKIELLVRDLHDGKSDIEFMTTDLNGVTGHIDHIVAARATCLAFYRLKAAGLPMTRVRLVCLPQAALPDVNTDFVFMEPGRPPEDIDEVIDGRGDVGLVHDIIRAHHTQRGDGEAHITNRGDDVAINYFKILH